MIKIPLFNTRFSIRDVSCEFVARLVSRFQLQLCLRAHVALFFLLIFIFASATTMLAQDNKTTTTTTTTEADIDEDREEGPEAVPTPQPTPNVPAKSIIRGRVMYEDTNRPVRRARIMLLKTDGTSSMEKSGATDERGEFIVRDIAAGSYIVMVDVPGIISPFSSVELEEGMNERAAIVAIKKEFEEVSVNGTNTANVQIRARRGGVVTGRVTYPDGDPAVGAQIIILRRKDNRLSRFITGFSPFSMMALRTDDRGVYRIAGLPPGEYILGASEANTREDVRDEYSMMGMFGNTNFSISYYQNETSLRQATAIKIDAGQEAGDINITIIDRAMFTIAGTVVARQGRAPVRARLSIQPKTDASALPFMEAGPNTETDEQGRWSFPSIPDGTYVIKVEPSYSPSEEEWEQMNRTRGGGTAEVAATRPRPPVFVQRMQEVTVAGGDLTNVIIEVNEGGRIQGTIAFEGSSGKEMMQGFSVVLTPRDGGAPTNHYGSIQPNGTFTIDRLPPGEFYLSVAVSGEKLYVKSIIAGSTDLTREPVRIASGGTVDNVRVRIASDMATLQGRVTSGGDAKPVRGALLLLVPADPARWRSIGSYLPGVTEADGTFKITAPPGSYLLLVLREDENLRMINEAFVRARAATAKAVTLPPDGRETVDVVAPSGPTTP